MERRFVGGLVPPMNPIPVRVCGWVVRVKVMKYVIFVVLRDHTGEVQITIERSDESLKEQAQIAQDLTNESAIEVRGTLQTNDKVKLGGMEIIPESIIVHSKVSEQLPIGRDYDEARRLDWRFLDMRMNRKARAVFDVQTVAISAMMEFWRMNGFTYMQSPKLMGAASEDGGAELFSLDYFSPDKRACLAQSPQLYKQYGIGAGIDRYAEIGPVFRANPSFTTRHDAEFTSIDMEMAWINNHHDVMDIEQEWLHHVLKRVSEECGDMIKSLFGQEVVIPSLPFPRFSMAEAEEILKGLGINIPPEKKGDLTPEAERGLAAHVLKEYGHEFVFVTDYIPDVRAFYHMRDPDTGLTKSFDLIWKGVEVTTGAQREHRYDVLAKQAQEKGVNVDQMSFYADLFRFGCPPHGGFGFGMTRMMMMLLGAPNVREVTFIYRGPNRLVP